MVHRRHGKSAKKPLTPAGKKSGRNLGLRGIYISFFKAWGRVPDEIGRQTPENVFFLLLNSGEDEEGGIEDLPPEAQKFYGL